MGVLRLFVQRLLDFVSRNTGVGEAQAEVEEFVIPVTRFAPDFAPLANGLIDPLFVGVRRRQGDRGRYGRHRSVFSDVGGVYAAYRSNSRFWKPQTRKKAASGYDSLVQGQ